MSLAAGTKLGRYEICSKIGEGGMGPPSAWQEVHALSKLNSLE